MPDGSWKREGKPEMMVYQDSAQLNFPKEKMVSCHADHSQMAKLRRGEGGAYPDIKRAIKQALLNVAEEQANVGLSRLQLHSGVKEVVEERSRHNGDCIEGSGTERTPVPAGKSPLDDAQNQGSSILEPQGQTADVLQERGAVSNPSPPVSEGHKHRVILQDSDGILDPIIVPPSTQMMLQDGKETPKGDTEALEAKIQCATDTSSDRGNVPSSPLEKTSPDKAMDSVKDLTSRLELCSASEEGNAEKVRSLLARGCSIHESSEQLVDVEKDAFLLAARNGRLDVLKVLLEHNCDVSKRTLNNRNTALHLISYDREIKPKPVIESLVILLLEHGVPLEARTASGRTPLLSSAYNGKLFIAECLLEHGADIHSTDYAGYTALHWAVRKGHHEVVALLISKGAPLEIRTKLNESTPLHTSCFAENDSGECAKLLLQAGADKEATESDYGCRPLHTAAHEGNLGAVNELLAFGVEIDAVDSSGWRALHLAGCTGHWRIIEALLAKGANPLMVGDDGYLSLQVGWKMNANISQENKEKCLKLLKDAEEVWEDRRRREKEKRRQERKERGLGRFSRFVARLYD